MIRFPFKANSKYFYAFLAIIAVSLILLVTTRVVRGLSAIVLSLLTTLIFLYWSNEIRLILKKQPGLGIIRSSNKFTYESIETNNGLNIIAQIPGQHSELKVAFIPGKIIITSNNGLFEKIKITKNLLLKKHDFKNGTLIINLLYDV